MIMQHFRTNTARIIFINVIVFFVSLFLLAIYGSRFVELAALQPSAILAGKNLWTLLTSMFLHLSLGHLLANMASLFFIGMFVEKLIGKKRILAFYLIAGLFAGLFYATLAYFFGGSLIGGRLFGTPEGFAIGASGAVFGLLGLLAVLTPRNKVFLIAGPIIAIVLRYALGGFFPDQSILGVIDLLITFYFIFAVFSMFSFNPAMRRLALPLEMPFWILPIIAIVPLVVVGLYVDLPIGNAAHLGGLIAGLVYGFYLRNKYPKRTRMISRRFS